MAIGCCLVCPTWALDPQQAIPGDGPSSRAKRSVSVRQNVVVVLDNSGSMNDFMRSGRRLRKMQAARVALKQVLAKLPSDSRVGIYAINRIPRLGNWVIPLADIDQPIIQTRIDTIAAKGATPLGAAIRESANSLLAAREKQVFGTYRMLIVTDGEAGDQQLVEYCVPAVRGRGIAIDVIGVDMKSNHSLATKVSSYRRADDPESLTRAIVEVFAETSDANDGDQSDYELLEGIDDEVAWAALEALTTTDNSPIETGNKRSRPQSTNRQSSTPPPPPGPASGGLSFGSLCCGGTCLLMFASTLFVLKGLVKS